MKLLVFDPHKGETESNMNADANEVFHSQVLQMNGSLYGRIHHVQSVYEGEYPKKPMASHFVIFFESAVFIQVLRKQQSGVDVEECGKHHYIQIVGKFPRREVPKSEFPPPEMNQQHKKVGRPQEMQPIGFFLSGVNDEPDDPF